MNEIMRGEATPGQIGGFLVALRLKGETADEIAGCAEAMREHVVPVRPKRRDLVDTAGTGGDGGKTFNISTAAALVAAAAGAGVANGSVRERTIDPEELGVPRCQPEELRGGTPEGNAQAIRDVFAGANGGRRDAILLNAAGAIAAGGHAADLREGLGLAREALDSGAAAERLEQLAAFSRGAVPR